MIKYSIVLLTAFIIPLNAFGCIDQDKSYLKERFPRLCGAETCSISELVKEENIGVLTVIESEGSTQYLVKSSDAGWQVTRPLLGELFVLKNAGRIIVLGISSHFLARWSYVFDFDLNMIAEINHDEVSRYGSTQDEKLFWMQLVKVSSGRPESRIKVFDYDGNLLEEVVLQDEAYFDLDFDGKNYRIVIPEAEWPG